MARKIPQNEARSLARWAVGECEPLFDGWQEYAACYDHPTPDRVFYPPPGVHPTEAREVCARCSVFGQCMTAALTYGEEYGVWASMSQRELHAVLDVLGIQRFSQRYKASAVERATTRHERVLAMLDGEVEQR